MKKWIAILALFIVPIAINSANAEEIDWVKDYEAALAQAKETNRPIMIDYYTDWCGWCKKLDKETYQHNAVVEKSDEFISAKINAEKDVKSARAHGVSSYPTILFLNSEGKEIWRVKGYKNGPQFLLEMVRAQAQTMPEDILKEQADVGDAEAAYFLAQKYLAVNDKQKANTYLQKAIESDPDNQTGYKADALLDLGFSYIQMKNNDAALEQYATYLDGFESDDRRDEALYYGGMLHLNLGEQDRANEYFGELQKDHASSVYTRQVKMVLQQLKRQQQQSGQ